MDVESGLQPDMVPTLDEFLLARIAEDERRANDAAAARGRADWDLGDAPEGSAPAVAEHVARHDPARVLVECAARRRLVLACRDSRLDRAFLGARPAGLADFPPAPADRHQLAALTLALLALPYADHTDYQRTWRP